MLQFVAQGVPVIAVQDNHTSMRVTAQHLQLEPLQQPTSDENYQSRKTGRILQARSYAEAAGLVVALRHGILLESCTAYVPPVAVTELV